MNRISRCALQFAGSLLLVAAVPDAARADPAGAAAPAADATPGQVSEVKGGFLSTFTQAFKEDFDREVVRGQFDTGSPPDTHRYYCLVDPKTGKNTPNAVSGETVPRRDGMTGIKGVAVSPLSCADAEQKGLLITSGYVVPPNAARTRAAGSAVPAVPAQPAAAPAAAARPAAEAVAPPAVASGAAITPAAATAPVTATAAVTATAPAVADSGVQWEIMAVYARFIAGQNAHDRAAVAAVLLDSPDFVWTPYGGNPVWGSRQAVETFAQQWQGTWKLEPQLKELRVASLAADTAVLMTPLLLTQGRTGADPSTVPVSWCGVFVKTSSGWRLATIFTAPLPGLAGSERPLR